MSDNIDAGRARKAAEILIDVWKAMGSSWADYDAVWWAKEYLYDSADKLESAGLERKT
jgi:hypothetical protein